MLSEEARSIRVALGVLAGRVDVEDWRVISQARTNLEALAKQLDSLELQPVPRLAEEKIRHEE